MEDCRVLAERRQWEIAEEYIDDDISAYSSTKRRPEYRRMLSDIKDGLVNAVVVYDQDRLTRQPAELEEFFVVCDAAGVTELLSFNVTQTGGGSGFSFDAAVSFNGSTVAFLSEANDLVANDGNFTTDVLAWSSTFAPPDPAPALTIVQQGGNVVLTWPSPATGYALESTDDLTPPATWMPVGAIVSDNGIVRMVTLPVNFNLDARFFRLKK